MQLRGQAFSQAMGINHVINKIAVTQVVQLQLFLSIFLTLF